MARRTQRHPDRRTVLCTSCNLSLDIAGEAKSVNCRHCNTRVITEAMDVDGYVAVRRFATANRMKIARKGIVYASVRAEALEVDGFLQGEAVALEGIVLTKNARVTANLRSPRLIVEPGATLIGDVQIGPEQVPEAENMRLPPTPEMTG
jgi:hypothetical protein